VTAHDDCRVSPFGHPRITARLTAPRGLSRPPTSFIGSWYQGIHRAPLKTWPQRCSRPLFSSQATTSPPHPTHTTRACQTQARYHNEETTIVPSEPNNVPDPTRPPPTNPTQAGPARNTPTKPNSQRSTHEQPCRTSTHKRPRAP
jgi:hypothetical protein